MDMNRMALHTIQLEQGAHFSDFGGWEKPESFCGCLDEQKAVREGMGLLDRSERGKLVLIGRDRFSWLQGMVSNDVRALEKGAPSIYACILNATGHLLADVHIVNRGDSLLLDMARENVSSIYQRLDGFLITEDVEIVDQSDYLACLSVQGPAATEAWVREMAGPSAHVVPADHTGSGGFDIYCKADEAPETWRRLADGGAQQVGEAAADTLRIEAGLPLFGVDMDEGVIALEANLEQTHISYDKGCYVGQEIIARIHSRGHTNRALTGFVLSESRLPHKGSKIYPTSGETDREVGWITSSTHSPFVGKAIALGYLRHELRESGTPLRIAHEDDAITAEVAALPFVNGPE
jgi:folate-binding protein YgfZ